MVVKNLFLSIFMYYAIFYVYVNILYVRCSSTRR